jgi:transcriptional regulator GlxA family with amidase domain
MTPEIDFASAGLIDLLVYPGGKGARQLAGDADHLAWMRDAAEEIPVLASVCTGALVFAAAGLLKGRPATTHWGALEKLAALDGTIDVRGDSRFVDDGDVITAAGVSAGIDMAIHLVARLAGNDRAHQVRHFLQYEPAPPTPGVPSGPLGDGASTDCVQCAAGDGGETQPATVGASSQA